MIEFSAIAGREPSREVLLFVAGGINSWLSEGGNLTKGEREMIIVATSAANQCLYCVVAHGAILRIYAKNPHIADQVAVDHRKADVSLRQRAMLDMVPPEKANDPDIAGVRAALSARMLLITNAMRHAFPANIGLVLLFLLALAQLLGSFGRVFRLELKPHAALSWQRSRPLRYRQPLPLPP